MAEITPSLSNFRPFRVWDVERDGSMVPYVPIPTLTSSSPDLGQFVSVTDDAEVVETLSKGMNIREIRRTEFKFPISFAYLPMGRKDENEFEKAILPRVWKCEDLQSSILDLVGHCEIAKSTAVSGNVDRVDYELLFLENREMSKHNLRALKLRTGMGLFDGGEIVDAKEYAKDWEKNILQGLKEITRHEGRDLSEALLERVLVSLAGGRSVKRMR